LVGHVDPQRNLYTCDNQYLKFVGEGTFYGFLAQYRPELFRDDDFVSLYIQNNGRTSVPPSILAKALLLQSHDRVSDEEAADRAQFDIRWKVALGIGIDDQPFVKSTLQAFRARLVLHQAEQAIFQRSIDAAKGSGLLKSRKLKVALDTTPIFGKGAVKDTYNLLADGIRQLVRALALLSGQAPETWAREHDLSRYYGTSIKGEAEIDWNNAAARQAFLDGIVVDAERLLAVAERVRAGYPPDSAESGRIDEAAGLLKQLLAQDVERTTEGQAALKDGVARDRVPSVTDPEMRHGRKSASRKFTGHKGAIVVERGEQHPVERGKVLARLGREIGAAVEWLQFGRQEDRERPAGGAGHDAHRLDVDLVHVGPFLPVYLDVDVVGVQDFRDLRVGERFAGHHVAPVAGRVADGQEYRFVLGLSPVKRLVAPRMPVDRVLRMVAEIRAGFAREAIRHQG